MKPGELTCSLSQKDFISRLKRHLHLVVSLQGPQQWRMDRKIEKSNENSSELTCKTWWYPHPSQVVSLALGHHCGNMRSTEACPIKGQHASHLFCLCVISCMEPLPATEDLHSLPLSSSTSPWITSNLWQLHRLLLSGVLNIYSWSWRKMVVHH